MVAGASIAPVCTGELSYTAQKVPFFLTAVQVVGRGQTKPPAAALE